MTLHRFKSRIPGYQTLNYALSFLSCLHISVIHEPLKYAHLCPSWMQDKSESFSIEQRADFLKRITFQTNLCCIFHIYPDLRQCGSESATGDASLAAVFRLPLPSRSVLTMQLLKLTFELLQSLTSLFHK